MTRIHRVNWADVFFFAIVQAHIHFPGIALHEQPTFTAVQVDFDERRVSRANIACTSDCRDGSVVHTYRKGIDDINLRVEVVHEGTHTLGAQSSGVVEHHGYRMRNLKLRLAPAGHFRIAVGACAWSSDDVVHNGIV